MLNIVRLTNIIRSIMRKAINDVRRKAALMNGQKKSKEREKKGREKEGTCNSASRCGIMHGGVHGAAFNPAITEISV